MLGELRDGREGCWSSVDMGGVKLKTGCIPDFQLLKVIMYSQRNPSVYSPERINPVVPVQFNRPRVSVQKQFYQIS